MIDLTNRVFGRLTVLEELERRKGYRMWLCLCECGTHRIVYHHALTAKRFPTVSCGCRKKEFGARINYVHGGYKTPEFRVWASMLQRCNNPKNKAFRNYGGRGIRVCERWKDFSSFISDMGPRPSSALDIERTDNSLGYEPNNCRWRTRSENLNNTRRSRYLEFNGKRLTVTQWASETGINRNVLNSRLRCGWPIEKVLTEPPDLRYSRRPSSN